MMFHWTDLVGCVPDFEARVLRPAEEGDTLWSEWEMTGTIADGVDLRAGRRRHPVNRGRSVRLGALLP